MLRGVARALPAASRSGQFSYFIYYQNPVGNLVGRLYRTVQLASVRKRQPVLGNSEVLGVCQCHTKDSME